MQAFHKRHDLHRRQCVAGTQGGQMVVISPQGFVLCLSRVIRVRGLSQIATFLIDGGSHKKESRPVVEAAFGGLGLGPVNRGF